VSYSGFAFAVVASVGVSYYYAAAAVVADELGVFQFVVALFLLLLVLLFQMPMQMPKTTNLLT